jgi:hypothetical protein
MLVGEETVSDTPDEPLPKSFTQRERANKPKSRKTRKYKATAPELTPSQLAQDSISSEDLLNLIAYNSFSSLQDLQRALDFTLSAKESNLINQAMTSEELQNFLRVPSTSSALSINANFADSGELSPLSFLSAQLSSILLSSENIVVLFYFCSLNTVSANPLANAKGLVSSLAGQLLENPNLSFDLSFVDEQMAQSLAQDDFVELVQLFLHLIHQLPSDLTVVCFIDEVSVYETPERRDQMQKLLATLVNQVIRKQESDDLVAFKMLLTDGNNSMAGDIIGSENVLDLQDDFDGEEVDPTNMVVQTVQRSIA